MHRPAISTLSSVIEPLISELAPLTVANLSAFTRSTLSKGVLQNLLAHVTAAEAEATTSEDERLDVVEDDWNFGPDRVGENYYGGKSIPEETIVAAKGLVDLCPKYNPCTTCNSIVSLIFSTASHGRGYRGFFFRI